MSESFLNGEGRFFCGKVARNFFAHDEKQVEGTPFFLKIFTVAILEYISDEKIIEIVKGILMAAVKGKNRARRKFHKNVIDPFGSLLEAFVFEVDHESWVRTETFRQVQKSLQNQVGEMHQKF